MLSVFIRGEICFFGQSNSPYNNPRTIGGKAATKTNVVFGTGPGSFRASTQRGRTAIAGRRGAPGASGVRRYYEPGDQDGGWSDRSGALSHARLRGLNRRRIVPDRADPGKVSG